jgi:hypothetical protein
MPRTHIKKRIKKQNTRKNNIRGGAAATNRFEGKTGPLRGLRRMAASIASKAEYDPRTIYTQKIFNYDKIPTQNIIQQDITSIFKTDENKPGIPYYTNVKYYSNFKPIDVLMVKKTTKEKQDLTRCIESEYLIDKIIINGVDIILITTQEGYSAAFHSNVYNFFINPKK